LREAVSFGGFRLGERTNVAAVRMLPGASSLRVAGGADALRRYWSWRDIPPQVERPMPDLIQRVHGLWRAAVARRLEGAARPGQAALLDVHLSGYAGDAVSGATFNEVRDAAGVLERLPYYGTRLGLDRPAALARAEALVARLEGAPARFALFEHKLPQST